jgi:hypothetical protein
MMSGSSNAKGKRAAKNEIWEQHKSIIQDLYCNDGKSLSQVMEIMENTYGFRQRLVASSLYII